MIIVQYEILSTIKQDPTKRRERLAPLVDQRCWADAFLIRAFEQRLLSLFDEGKLSGTIHTSIGQELIGIALARSLQTGDLVFSGHRCHGHYLARTSDVHGLMAEILGRESGICGGRGGSQHICADGFFSNGIQGGIMPVSAGLALALKLGREGKIAVVFIGDGTLGEGVVYETLNIASKWELPLAVVLEDNGYAQSTSQSQTLAGSICLRAEAFGIPAFNADIWTPERLFQTAAEAISHVRQKTRPAFLRVGTYRLMAHSKGDDYRDPNEVKRYWSMDPLVRFEEDFPDEARRFQEQAESRVSLALSRASQSPTLSHEPIDCGDEPEPCWHSTRTQTGERVADRIYSALRSNMVRDARILCIGEDIESPYGGAFKVTRDLSQLFPGRVLNTPISEGAMVGLANGLALRGYIPVVEIMFGDFLTLACDQLINHAAKFRYMYNDQARVPIIIRTPMGGKRGYGPTHSQSLEKHFLGIPDTQILALHHRYDPMLIYDRLFATVDRPVLVIENKGLYGRQVVSYRPAGFVWEHTEEDFPTSRLRPCATPDITIVCYGGMLIDVERAVERLFNEYEIVAEVLCPIELYPLRIKAILQSVERTRRLLVVEEGQLFSGFGAELLALVQEKAPGMLSRARRLGPLARPIPSSKEAELRVLPSTELVVNAAVEVIVG